MDSTQLVIERAALLVKANDMQGEMTLQQALVCVPDFPDREKNVQSFAWSYGSRENLVDRKKVSETLALRTKVECEKLVDCNGKMDQCFNGFLGMPIGFHEAFVGSDAERARLIERLDMLYDTQWKNDIVALHLQSFPEAKDVRGSWSLKSRRSQWGDQIAKGHYYNIAKVMLVQHRESLLQIQALCEELKPETRELVTRCTHFEQLELSMLSMM
jgi:hypothetical protein